jgi:hypothetical protein
MTAPMFAAPDPLADYPARLRRMHKDFGMMRGRTCGGCVHFERPAPPARYAKCDICESTDSGATDWRAGWTACAAFWRRQK